MNENPTTPQTPKPLKKPYPCQTNRGEMDILGGESWVVLYFYPKDLTPGCTTESKDFAEFFEQFQALNCQIFGVSRDGLKSHQKFVEKLNLPFALISDEKEELCQHFGVIGQKQFMGKKFIGIIRSTFILNPQGQVVKSFRNVKVKAHALEVLDTLKNLQS